MKEERSPLVPSHFPANRSPRLFPTEELYPIRIGSEHSYMRCQQNNPSCLPYSSSFLAVFVLVCVKSTEYQLAANQIWLRTILRMELWRHSDSVLEAGEAGVTLGESECPRNIRTCVCSFQYPLANISLLIIEQAARKKHTYVWQCVGIHTLEIQASHNTSQCCCGYPSIPYRSASCPSCGYGRCGNCCVTKIQVR